MPHEQTSAPRPRFRGGGVDRLPRYSTRHECDALLHLTPACRVPTWGGSAASASVGWSWTASRLGSPDCSRAAVVGEKNRQIPAEGRQNTTQTDVTGCPEPSFPPLTSRLGQQICLIVSYIGSGKPIAVPNNRQDIYGRLHDRKGDDTTDVTQLSKCSRLRRQVC